MAFEQLLIDKGFKPSSFHRIVNLERQSIYSYRKGTAKPSLESIEKIAKALNTSADEVLACFKQTYS